MANEIMIKLKRMVAYVGDTNVGSIKRRSNLKHLKINKKTIANFAQGLDDVFNTSIPKKEFEKWKTFGDIYEYLRKNVNGFETVTG